MVGRLDRMVQLPRSVVHRRVGELLRADGKEQGWRRADGCRSGNSRNAALVIPLSERIRRDQLRTRSVAIPHVADYAQRCRKTGEEAGKHGYGRTLCARIA